MCEENKRTRICEISSLGDVYSFSYSRDDTFSMQWVSVIATDLVSGQRETITEISAPNCHFVATLDTHCNFSNCRIWENVPKFPARRRHHFFLCGMAFTPTAAAWATSARHAWRKTNYLNQEINFSMQITVGQGRWRWKMGSSMALPLLKLHLYVTQSLYHDLSDWPLPLSKGTSVAPKLLTKWD